MACPHIDPYLIELGEIIETALYEYTKLGEAARLWCEIERELAEQAMACELDEQEFAAKLSDSPTRQTHIFDALAVFLAAWSRASLIVYPLGGDDDLVEFRQERGERLQRLLELPATSPVNNAALRDAWMHYDQRLDRAVRDGYARMRQRFVLSSEAAALKPCALRLVEADTLVVHFRDADGAQREASLPEIARALAELQERIPAAWDRLRKEEWENAVEGVIDRMRFD